MLRRRRRRRMDEGRMYVRQGKEERLVRTGGRTLSKDEQEVPVFKL